MTKTEIIDYLELLNEILAGMNVKGELNIRSPSEVFDVIEKYYRKNRIKPATQFFIEEIFENENDPRS